MGEAFIIEAVRTATGKNHGRLSKWHPIDLGAAVVDELLLRTGMPGDKVDDVIVGCVNKIGAQSMNIGRNIVLSSNLPVTVPGATVDRQCGSSLQAIDFGAQAILSGDQDVVIAAGVEVMSLVPISAQMQDSLEKGRGNCWGPILSDRYSGVQINQIVASEMCARKYGITREELDQFALRSHQKAAVATTEGRFKKEILPVEVELENGSRQMHEIDEGIRFDSNIEKMRSLKPLMEGGLLTAASSSQISDGAAAVLLAGEKAVREYNLKPRARVAAMNVIACDPVIMVEGPIPATKSLLKKSGLNLKDIDLFEVNEAFGSMPLSWIKALKADVDKLNVNGGAQALGHPLGCTGAKLMATLLHELERTNGRYGLVTICEASGTANAMIIERL